jgi:hypothetical protein
LLFGLGFVRSLTKVVEFLTLYWYFRCIYSFSSFG